MRAAAPVWIQTGAPGTEALCRSGGVGVWGDKPHASAGVTRAPRHLAHCLLWLSEAAQRVAPRKRSAGGRPQGGLDLSHKHFGT